MSDINYAEELLSPKPQPIQQTTDIDYASALMDQRATSGQQAGSGEFPALGPKPIADPRRAAGFGASVLGGIPTNKQAAIRIFAQQRGIPASRYQVVDGDIVYQADDGNFYKEVVGPVSSAGYYAPDVAEMVPDTVAAIASAPLTLLGPLGVATAAGITGSVSAGSNYLRQKLAGLLGGQELNPTEVAVSGILGGVAETVPAIRKGIVERRTARDIGQMNVPMIQSLRAKAGRLDIPLTPAELTSLASLTSQQKVLTNIPDSQVKMKKFYRYIPK
jgi:hypothetical protein